MNISYRFRLQGGAEIRFALRLDPETLGLIPAEDGPPPEWTRLGNRQCPHCPLSEDRHPYCPIARNLAGVIREFAPRISFEEADISIATDARQFRRRAPLDNGISGLIGIVMVTSGCPHLDKLRPMVYSHLPFASTSETSYRAISMYLLAQYLRRQRGLEPDWSLAGLVRIYEAVSLVNRHFVERLRTIKMLDASLNAIVKLDCFATLTAGIITAQSLAGVERLFQGYLGGPETDPVRRP
ncbi:MAG: hypothetical protein NTY77_08375 [Elusimicrobia bacterium]|nr:hypothetical protein [Elusimicrobiota bacterium]